MMEWHPEFRIGRTRLQVSFTGGHLCGGACTPASFETSDPVVQKVIEGSAAFRNGRISIGKVMEDGQPDRRSERPRAQDLKVMEFDSMDAASDFLQKEKGVLIDSVLTPDQCVSEARGLGIELVIRK